MSRLISNISVLISLSAIFTVAYIAVIQNYFLYMDDYFYMLWDYFGDQIRGGRFLNSIFLSEIFNYIRLSPTIDSGVRGIRFIGIIGISLLSFVIFKIFRIFRFKTEHALLISILVCTLPPIQVYVSWVQGVPWIYSTVFSALSALVLFKFVFKENSGEKIYTVSALLLSIILLLSALCTYQPAAMIFWSMALIPLARLKNEDLTEKWHTPFIKYFSVGFVSLAIYFIIVKIVHFILYGQTDTGARGALIGLSMIKHKIMWFLTSPLKNSLNLWNISPTYTLGAMVAIIILVGLAFGLRQAISLATKERNFILLRNHFQRLILIFSILPLSLLPTLMVTESWATYRTVIALEVSILILLCTSLLNIGEFIKSETKLPINFKKAVIPIILIILAVFGVYDAHSNVKKYFAEIHSMELQYVRNVIQEYGISNLSETKRSYVKEHGKMYHFVKNSPFEFGQPSTNASPRDPESYAIDIVKYVLYELGIHNEIEVISVRADEPLPEERNALIIDLARLGVLFDERLKN